jgi:RecA-family ATPase
MKTATEQFADEFNRGIYEELARIEPKAKVLEFNDAPAQTNGHVDEAPPVTSLAEFDLPEEGTAEIEPAERAATVPAALDVTNAAAFAEMKVPPRRWLIPGRIPMTVHTLLSGDGAAGKTTILLQLCHAVVRGTDWLGAVVNEPGPAIFLTGEEDQDEIHRRVSAINAHTGTDFAGLAHLHFISLPGQDAVLATTGKDGIVRATPLFDRLAETAKHIRPKLIAIEAAADVFAGNENSRPEVRQFSQIMRRLAIYADAAVVLVQHPSVAGLAEGNGRSGSTGWRNSFRSQLNFARLRAGKDDDETTDSDLRVLSVGKTNYGPEGERVTLRWQRGVFVPEGSVPSLDRLAAEADTDALFMRLLQVAITQGRNVSPSKSPSYAPAIMERMPDANGVKSRAFAAAMERLLAKGKIKIETHGSEMRQRKHLTVAE